MSQLEINTRRLFLRSLKQDDAEALFNYRSDAITNKYQGWVPNNIQDVYHFIRNKVSPVINVRNTWHQLIILTKEGNKAIGDIGLHFIDKEEKHVEIGFTLDKNYHGKGYAAESLKSVISYLFSTLNKNRVSASIDPNNHNARKLMKRLGFKREPRNPLYNGAWGEDLIFSISNYDWIYDK